MALLEVRNLVKYFPVKTGFFGRTIGLVKAVDGVSITIEENQTVALVGESGSGKTTLARCLLGLIPYDSGEIIFQGKKVSELKGEEEKWYRRNIQVVFQNPFLSLNPRMRVESIIAEPLKTHTSLTEKEVREEVERLTKKVGLPKNILKSYPYMLSGGQAQRVAIARAIALKPKLVILDEPTSALDVSVQAQILNLLIQIKKEIKNSYLLITHDLSVVRYMSDKIYVMYLGKIVEEAPTKELFQNPKHPYTQALLSAIPEPDPRLKKIRKRIKLKGEPPSQINPPPGCNLHPRCPFVMEKCKTEKPPLREVEENHKASCWLNL